MPVPLMHFRNNEQAARAVYSYIRACQPPVRHLTLRPHNRFDTAFTTWWLVPSTDWPAYRYSKLFFLKSEDNAMFTGLYIEKGLGRQLAELAKGTHLMHPNWFWYDFLNAARGGVLDAPMRDVIEQTGIPLQVDVRLYEFNHVPDPETRRQAPDDEATFSVREDLRLVQGLPACEALAALNGAFSLQDLVGRFVALAQMTWYWVDWMIGIRMPYSPDGAGDWGAAALWDNALAPWLRWVR